jgi:hypothetical protein
VSCSKPNREFTGYSGIKVVKIETLEERGEQ